MRRAFCWAFIAACASSPSTPSKRGRSPVLFLRLSCSSPVFFIASRGVSLLSLMAGSHAEIHIVPAVAAKVIPSTSGWYPKTDLCLSGATFSSMAFVSCTTPILAPIPSRFPAITGTALRAAASCKRQARICLGVAPILEKMPN